MAVDIPKDILAYFEGKTMPVECEKVRALRASHNALQEAVMLVIEAWRKGDPAALRDALDTLAALVGDE